MTRHRSDPADRGRTGREDPGPRGVRRRGGAGAPGPDRRRRRPACTRSCTSAPSARWTRRAPWTRTSRPGGDARVAAGRCAAGAQGRRGHRGRPDHGRLADAGELDPALRRDRDRASCSQAGIVILGKTNMDEFAMGSSTENSAYGPTHNPWDLDRMPGGSGGGSSASLAAFEAPLAIGTDTGGSIRQPGAVTGTVGVKPTYGGVSRYGLVAFSSSLDQAGPCARTVLDAALLHEVIAGHDPLDSTSIDEPVPPVVAAAREGAPGDLTGVRVGVVTRCSAARATSPACCTRSTPPSAAEGAGRRGRRGVLPALRVRAARVLPDRAERVLVQPGPVRRDALRPAGRRRRRRQRRGGHGRDPGGRASGRRSSGASCWARTRCRPATTTPTTARRRRSAR